MEVENLRRLNALRRARKAAVLASDLAAGSSQVIAEGDFLGGELGAAVASALRSGRAGALHVEGRELFLNVYLPQPRLVVIGAVHISQILAPMVSAVGYDIEIVDPRTAFASPERFPSHMPIAEWPEDVLAAAPLDAHCALAVLTHDPKIDDYPLLSALKAECFYIGALGSRKTHAKRLERLSQAGASEQQLARIHGPIGLDIGASNPAEIAVAILAQVIAAHRTRGQAERPA